MTTDTTTHQRNFAIGLSLIATAITMASAAATYSLNLDTFRDWTDANYPLLAKCLSILATAGIELTFALLLYGISNAVTTPSEKILSVLGLVGILGVMSANFMIHRQIVKGIALSEWQTGYYQWGCVAIQFGIVGLIILLKWASPEASKRRMDREIDNISHERGLMHKREILDSPDLGDYMEQFKPAIYRQVVAQLKLPASSQSRPAIAQTQEPEQSETPTKIGFARSAKYRNLGPKA